jgi:transcription initiation factor TFIIIB Brf1 subunit/transcription initiation factor TFIIB
MASIRSAARSMRFPCGHSEPEATAGRRVRTTAGRAVWIACRQCNVLALVCEPAKGTSPPSGKA